MKRWFANSPAHFGIFGANSLSKIAFGFIVRSREGPHGLVLNLPVDFWLTTTTFKAPPSGCWASSFKIYSAPTSPIVCTKWQQRSESTQWVPEIWKPYICMTILKTSLGFMEDFPLWILPTRHMSSTQRSGPEELTNTEKSC